MEEAKVQPPSQDLPSGPGGTFVQAQGEVAGAAGPDSKVTKVIVAVHGVGDQHTLRHAAVGGQPVLRLLRRAGRHPPGQLPHRSGHLFDRQPLLQGEVRAARLRRGLLGEDPAAGGRRPAHPGGDEEVGRDHRGAAAGALAAGEDPRRLRRRRFLPAQAGAGRDDPDGRRGRADLPPGGAGRPVHLRPAQAVRRLPGRRPDRHGLREIAAGDPGDVRQGHGGRPHGLPRRPRSTWWPTARGR